MMQQLMTSNRFISLTSPDPDDSDTEIEPTEPIVSDNAVEDVSMDSDTEYFDAIETVDVDTDDDVPYFQQGPNLLQGNSGKLLNLSISSMYRQSHN